jgi:hypothetical protein
VVEAPGFVAGVDDVCSVGDAVHDGFGEAGVGEDLGPLAEREVGRDDQRGALIALGDDLKYELRGTVGQSEIPELVEDDELGAGVARDDAAELAAALGRLQLVREGSEGGEPDAASLLAGEGSEGEIAKCVLPVPESPRRMTLSRSSIQVPCASAAIVAWGIFGFSSNWKSSRRLVSGNLASISRRRSRRSERSVTSASKSAARYAVGVCWSRVASSVSPRKRARTVGR